MFMYWLCSENFIKNIKMINLKNNLLTQQTNKRMHTYKHKHAWLKTDFFAFQWRATMTGICNPKIKTVHWGE